MPISGVGTFTSTSGTAITTKSTTTVNAGDLVTFTSLVNSSARTISSISGGTADVGGWSPLATWVLGGTGIEMWQARVGTPGTATITVTWNTSVAGLFVGYTDRSFTAGLGPNTVWAADVAGSGQSNSAATTCAYPPKTPTAAGRLYAGYGFGSSLDLVAGSTSGYTYHIDSFGNCFIWNPSISALTSPTSGTTASQTSASIGVLISASPPPGGWVPPIVSSYNSFH